MTSTAETRRKPIWLLIVIPPLLFIAKDIIATIIVLSYEPGITERAVINFSLELLPGSFFVPNNYALTFNACFGLAIGAILYFVVRSRRRR